MPSQGDLMPGSPSQKATKAMIESDLLNSSIRAVLFDFGFQRKRSCYFMRCPETLLVVELRKSTHGNYYYLDCGINILSLANEEVPRANNCHVQFNFNLLAVENVEILGRALDIESATMNDLESLTRLMRERCLPTFLCMKSVSDLRRLYASGKLKGFLLLGPARSLLEAVA